MKIVYVLNEFRDNGAELGLLDLVENGFFAGHELKICALARGVGKVGDRLSAAVGPDHSRWLSEAPFLRDRALPMAIVRLAGVFRSEMPDLIVLSLPQANLVGRLASLVVPRAVVVSFEHCIGYRRRIARVLMTATSPLVDAVFYDHPQTWSSLKSVFPGVSEQRAHYVPLTAVVPLSVPVPLPAGRRHCVTTMRLEGVKNHASLFHAIRSLVDGGYDLDLTVVGDGPLREELAQLVERLGLQERVRMAGSMKVTPELLCTFDTYVLSSTKEGLSRSVIEAMAAGLLVVSTDVGGIREYGIDNENMIKARGTGPAELAAALKRALDLGPGARRLQEGALRTIEQEFSPRVVRQHWREAMSGVEAAAMVRLAPAT